MEELITTYLKEKYNPLAIILYGSRASNKANKDSDWDFVILVENEIEVVIEMIEGQIVDLDVIKLPVSKDELIKQFDGTLQISKVVFDTNDIANKLLESIKEVYSKGRNLRAKELENRKNFITRRLNKLESSLENNAMFFFHLGIFFEKAVQYWFEIKKNRWKVAPATALKIVEEEDKNYSDLLGVLYSNLSNQEKLDSARKIISLLV
ncbi:MAG: hypothetical protein A3D37_01485 [Candidatus Zambryskibacteria bacterium RIFCSPHIGHO2_02_FULL_38_22]|nr:MAG: hypothetical protein A3D37_01485 [Candidatus Zambryskibacteria bacterium RIFCSPHIGHO2_02_FULL_38_22]